MLVKRLALLAALLLAAPAFGQTAKVVTDCTGITYDVGSTKGLIQDQNGKLCVNNVATGAPADATYITETANGSLSAEFALGSLSSGLLKNATTTGIPTVVVEAAGIDTWLTTPSSANLIAALTDETGTGAAVFATSPTLVTPALGVATGTSFNKVAITAPATSATLTITDGKTLASSNTLTFAGTDGSTLNVGTGGTLGTAALVNTGTSGATIPVLNVANTWSVGTQAFTSNANTVPLTIAMTGSSSSGAAATITTTLTSTSTNPNLTLLPTWNVGSNTPTAFKINLTDTASGAASLLADLQVATVSKFKVDKSGNTTVAGTSALSDTATITKTSAGASTIGLALINSSVSAGTETVIDMAPNASGTGVRSAQIASKNVGGSTEADLEFRVANGGAPTNALVISKAGALSLPFITTQGPLVTDTSGNVTSAISGTATFDPSSLLTLTGQTTTITVTGAALGDIAVGSFSLDLQGIQVTYYISATNTCSARFFDATGGTVDLASGTLKCKALK